MVHAIRPPVVLLLRYFLLFLLFNLIIIPNKGHFVPFSIHEADLKSFFISFPYLYTVRIYTVFRGCVIHSILWHRGPIGETFFPDFLFPRLSNISDPYLNRRPPLHYIKPLRMHSRVTIAQLLMTRVSPPLGRFVFTSI